MKKALVLLFILFITQNGHLSGSRKKVPLRERCSKFNNIFIVKIVNTVNGIVREIDTVNKSVSSFHGYSAVILKIINKSNQLPSREAFHIKFPSAETTLLEKIKAKGIEHVAAKDTIIIMNAENIKYSIIYEVQGLRKIFFYYYSPDAVKTVQIGGTYILIADNSFSRENGVLYGNVDYGLYPNTAKMRERISTILKSGE